MMCVHCERGCAFIIPSFNFPITIYFSFRHCISLTNREKKNGWRESFFFSHFLPSALAFFNPVANKHTHREEKKIPPDSEFKREREHVFASETRMIMPKRSHTSAFVLGLLVLLYAQGPTKALVDLRTCRPSYLACCVLFSKIITHELHRHLPLFSCSPCLDLREERREQSLLPCVLAETLSHRQVPSDNHAMGGDS
jgi:hypothetical protein